MTDADGNIGGRMAKGAAWMVAVRLFDRMIGLISTVILARLLFPADFGVVALAMSIIAVLEIWAEFGFDLALIRDQKAEQRHYDTVWTLTFLRSVIVAMLIAATAGHMSAFFNEARIESVMYALSAATLIEGCQSVRIIDFRKNLDLHKEFRFLMIARVAQFVVTIVAAYLWRDYWALVAGILVNRSTKLMLSYLMAPHRPRFSLSGFSDLFGFSKWVVINSLLTFFNTRLDTFVIGRVSGVSSLGIYNMAYEVSNMATTELVWPISRALFPGFSKLQDRPSELVKAYNMSLSIIVLIALPVTVGIGLTAEYFVPLMLGQKWLLAIPVMQVLVIYGGLRVLIANTGALYLALGRPYLISIMGASNLVVLAPAMIWAVQAYGTIGAAWAVVAGSVPVVVLMFVFNRRFLGTGFLATLSLNIRPVIGAFLPVIGAFLMSVTVLFLETQMPVSEDPWILALSLAGLAGAGGAVYISSVLLMARRSRTDATAESLVASAVSAKFSRRGR